MFVSGCSLLRCLCRLGHVNCLLLVFRRWGQLITWHHLYHKGWLWLVHFNPPIGPLLQWVAVPSVVCCCTVFRRCFFFYHGHPCFRNFNSTIPVDVIRVKSVRISINKLFLVPNQIVASHMGMFRLLIETLTCTHVGSRKLSTQDFTPIT